MINIGKNRIGSVLLCSLLLLLSLSSTGCFRIYGEVSAFRNQGQFVPNARNPRDRFFLGTKLVSAASVFFTPLVLVDFPLEFVADLTMIPFDLAYSGYYSAKPPLGLLVKQRKNDQLAIRLQNGADPNEIDYRFDKHPPLYTAFHAGNVKAAQLLIEHGAKIQDVSYFSGNNTTNGVDQIALQMLRAGIPPEMAQKEEAKFYVNNWVNQWISHSLEQNQKKRDGALEFEAISLLLKYGFPVNHIKDYKYDNRTSFTALDTVLMAKRLNPEIRQKMVDLLRSYNAKTYLELVTEDETLPHLDLSGIEVDPQFQKIVEILQHSEDAAGYRVSAHYPGLEGPLLVIDFLAASEAKQGKSHTKTIQFHRRKNNNEWNQTCESVEIPEYYRIILTPKGKKVPSQISPDWPREKVLLEQWVSLESCEMYVAFNPERHTRHIMEYRDLEAIVWTIVPPDVSKYDARRLFKYHEIPIDDSFFLDFAGVFNPEKGAIPSQPLMEAALQRANSKLAALGLPGKWHSRGINRFKLGGKQIAMGFVYSSIRTLEELKNTPSPIAPLPNEILILAWEKWPPEPMPERIVFREQYKECLGYWNSAYWEADSNYCKKSATILYGDNVSSETLNNISQTISELLQ